MIAKVVRGWQPAGLIRYLFGPGQHEEHTAPRVVAAFDGLPWLRQPPPLAAVELDGQRLEPGPHDLDLRPLTRTMQGLFAAAGVPVRHPPPITPDWAEHLRARLPIPSTAPGWVRDYRYDPRTDQVIAKQGPVWHCPVRLHPDDPHLSDAQWEMVAQRLMEATGIHSAGCRWIAVRHADDHIHLMATLVTEDGQRFHPQFDHLALRRECRRLEAELGLVGTAPADRTATRRPTRAELAKTARAGRAATSREELRRIVAGYAAATTGPGEFLRALREEGVDPQIVRDGEVRIRGYTVAHPHDHTSDGRRVRFGGSRLARDLSWPCLARRWHSVPAIPPVPRDPVTGRVPPRVRQAVLDETTALVRAAAARARAGQDVEGLAHATGELLVVLARAREGRDPGPWTQVAERFDRAARTPYRIVPSRRGLWSRELGRASRRIAALGTLHGRLTEGAALLALALALAGLVAEIAAWQQTRARPHQAAAAHATTDHLHQHAGTRATANHGFSPPRSRSGSPSTPFRLPRRPPAPEPPARGRGR